MKCRVNNISQEYLKSILNYNPDTGLFRWKVRTSNRIKIGDIAGSIHKCRLANYISIQIDGHKYQAHRLAHLYIYGWMPEEVDHIDDNGPKTDNRICNLRKSTISQNMHNRGEYKSNKSGYKGVSWHKRVKKWRAQIKYNNKVMHLGYFSTPEEAYEAYKEAALRLHGEYARF